MTTEVHPPIALSAAALAGTRVMPSVCARHGLPAVTRRTLRIPSVPDMTGAPVTYDGRSLAARWAERGRRTRVVPVRDWPLCAVCRRTRWVWAGLSVLLFWGGLVAVLGTFLVAATLEWFSPEARAGLTGSGVVAMVLSIFPLSRGGMLVVLGTRASEDGSALMVYPVHPRFVEQVRDLEVP